MGSRGFNSGLFSVSPQTMIFYSPYDRTQKRIMTILNPTAGRLLFKIRSNAAYKYCVSPNCGCIEPYDTSEVNVSLNYFDFHDDRSYNHHFSILCIRSTCDNDEMQSQSILCIFKKIHRSEINNVRVPIELQPNPICIPQEELEKLLPPDALNIIRGNLHPVGLDHLKHMPLPIRRKKRCGLLRTLATFIAIITTLAGAFMQRHSIEQLVYMHLKLDQVEF
ncbi:vesicle-associated membrane protein-associated protein A [Drosophila innubila]|uniref:vesicle-associated membrane protein-associated protein A n=1 Tax=Drosophila innubila TaxID=198719 RepID=UPI00148CD6F0|nr:vesicle-associated membrane protein-associated protein A [Drosophila innubila]